MSRLYEEYQMGQDRGFQYLDGSVCANCITDQELKILHSKEILEEEATCSFCNEKGNLAPAHILQERIMNCLKRVYDNVEEAGAPWESREGGWQVPNDYSTEVLSNNLTQVVSEEFKVALGEALYEQLWCEKDWQILSPFAWYSGAWITFCGGCPSDR